MARRRIYYNPGMGERLSQLMYERNVSAVQLCKDIGMYEHKAIYTLQDGSMGCSIVLIYKICAHFGVSADWLLYGKGAK